MPTAVPAVEFQEWVGGRVQNVHAICPCICSSIYPSVHPSIHPSIQYVFTENLLCVRQCAVTCWVFDHISDLLLSFPAFPIPLGLRGLLNLGSITLYVLLECCAAPNMQ